MNLVNVSDYGIKGVNYYYSRKKQFNLSDEELASVGVTENFARLDRSLIPKLVEANNILQEEGFEIIVKDGYRSPELYDLVRKKRYEIDGKENTDKTLSTSSHPHSSGFAVDLNLINLKTGQEVEMWIEETGRMGSLSISIGRGEMQSLWSSKGFKTYLTIQF
jgi:hypothetical protein